jgi:hypothetical protein
MDDRIEECRKFFHAEEGRWTTGLRSAVSSSTR